MNQINFQYYKSLAGELIIGSFNEKLCFCDWRYRKMRRTIDSRITTGLHAVFVEQSSEVIQQTISQLQEYFKNERKDFDIPVLLVGTDFQKQVWNELLQIPYGKTESYLGLAKRLNNKSAIRAIASANGANAISIIVPCHRIIGTDGNMVGYAGGLPAKQKLLEIEGYDAGGQMKLF